MRTVVVCITIAFITNDAICASFKYKRQTDDKASQRQSVPIDTRLNSSNPTQSPHDIVLNQSSSADAMLFELEQLQSTTPLTADQSQSSQSIEQISTMTSVRISSPPNLESSTTPLSVIESGLNSSEISETTASDFSDGSTLPYAENVDYTSSVSLSSEPPELNTSPGSIKSKQETMDLFPPNKTSDSSTTLEGSISTIVELKPTESVPFIIDLNPSIERTLSNAQLDHSVKNEAEFMLVSMVTLGDLDLQEDNKALLELPKAAEETVKATSLSSSTKDCIRRCPKMTVYTPICGTDYVTYRNRGHLSCAQKCGVDVSFISNGVCPASNTATTSATIPTMASTATSRPVTRTTTWPTKPNTSSTAAPISSTTSTSTRNCIRACPVTSEYNPVCGTDLVTYLNPGRLLCAQMCGIAVKELSKGQCSSSTSTSTTIQSTGTATQSNKVKDCVNRCRATPEYNPVCGTDYVKYKNENMMLCARACGVDVKILKRGPCPKRPT